MVSWSFCLPVELKVQEDTHLKNQDGGWVWKISNIDLCTCTYRYMHLHAYAHIQHKHTQRHVHKKRKRKKKRKLVTTHTSFKARTLVFIVCLSVYPSSTYLCVHAIFVCVCLCAQVYMHMYRPDSMLASLQLFSILICETGLSLSRGLADLAHWLGYHSRDRPCWVHSARNTVPTAALDFLHKCWDLNSALHIHAAKTTESSSQTMSSCRYIKSLLRSIRVGLW